jgi:hypothetical protein
VSLNYPAPQPPLEPSSVVNNTGLSKFVMDMSPSIYGAAAASNLNSAQTNMINQIAGTVQTYKALSNLPVEEAKKNYKALGQEAQAMIKAMYGSPEWTNTDGWVTKAIKTASKTVIEAAASPLIGLYKAAGIESKIINAPYLFIRELQQGQSVFDHNTYGNAWDGRSVFNTDHLATLQKTYGKANAFVAQGILKGQKPGEIIDSYGKVDQDLYQAMANMLGNTKEFNNMMDQFRAAQVSPGRDIAKLIFNVPMTDSHFYSTNKWKITSGTIDAFYEILHDPLTYLTGGTKNIAEASTKGAILAEKLLNDPVLRSAEAEKMFAPGTKVAKDWDTNYGPLIKRVVDADKAKDPVAKASAMESIRTNAPEINDRSFIDLLGKAKVFDAEGAKNFAKTMQGAQELHMGTVDGPTFLRMGIPVARRERFASSAANRVMSDFLNGKITKEEADAATKKGVSSLIEIGKALDPVTGKPGVNYNPALDDLTNQMTLGRRISRMVQTHPGHEKINIFDENVKETLPVVNKYLRLAGYPKYAADPMTAAFEYANPIDRTLFVRGLYSQILNKMGVPEETRRAVLEAKFADSTTFSNSKNVYIAPQHLDEWKQVGNLEHSPLEGEDNLFKVTTNGPLHSIQAKPHIGGLDFNGNELAPFGFNFAKTRPGYVAQHVIGGITRSTFARRITNLWASGSIFPRIGFRGTIEQGIFHYLTAPVDNITKWARGYKLNRLSIGVTGRNENIPPVSRALQKFLGIDPGKWIPEKSVYSQSNHKLVQGHLDKSIVSGQEVWTAAQHMDLVHAVESKIQKLSGGDPETADIMRKFLKYPTATRSAEVNSVIARSALHQGAVGGELDQSLLSKDGITRMLKELEYEATGDLKYVDPKEIATVFGEQALSAAHYRAWAPIFQRWNTLDGFHFGENFIKHNALRTGKDFANARNAILERFGVDPQTLKVKNKSAFKKYLNFSMQAGRDVSERGLTEVQSMLERVQIGLEDMHQIFHGSPIKFNEELFNAIKTTAEAEVKSSKIGMGKAIRRALDKIQYNNFEELTRFNRPEQEFKSDLDFANKSVWDTDPKEVASNVMTAIKNFGQGGVQGKMLHLMDLQINSLFNQPAFRVAAMNLNKKYAPLEAEMMSMLIKEGYSKELARDISERHFVELAEKNAAKTVVKFIDNSARQSNLSFTLRTSGRFYRAQEQFQRRIYRMIKDYPLRSLYRMRLLHLGIDNCGFIHQDQNGNPYFTMPGDDAMFNAVNATLNFFLNRPDTAIVQPMFADFNMNLINSSPSLGPDAGVPSFQGPLMSVPILGLKGLLQHLPWGWGKVAASKIDGVLLGARSSNLTLSKVQPLIVQRFLDSIPKDERDHQVASAAMMAIAYNAYNGIGGLTPQSIKGMDPAEYEKRARDHIDNITVTANNVLWMRALLGMGPLSPTMVAKSDISGYLKDVGIGNFSQEFNDLVQGVMRNDTGLDDPYEIALGMFTQKYPGRAIFTGSKSDKSTRLLQAYSENTQNWMLRNSKWVNNSDSDVAAASLIFAPDIGKYDPNTYIWMQSSGMIKQKPLADYLRNVLTAQDTAAYWNARYREEQALRVQSPDRAGIIAEAQNEQKAILISNPVLAQTIGDASAQASKYKKLFSALGSIIQDQSFPMNDAVRKKMNAVYSLVNSTVAAMVDDTAANGYYNTSSTKENLKIDTLNRVAEIGGAANPGDAPTDPQIAEAMKSIITPLLNSLSKTTLKAGYTR